jgi:hypothetical protein
MVPNMKAIDRLEDVEAKLVDTEKEADKARKDSRNAKETFNDVKKKRYAFLLQMSCCHVMLGLCLRLRAQDGFVREGLRTYFRENRSGV